MGVPGWNDELTNTTFARTRKAIKGLGIAIATVSEEARIYNVDTLRSRNFIRPAVNLPPEILSTIFVFAGLQTLSLHDELDGDDNPGSRPVLLHDIRNSVILICHHWREVVLKARALWATVFVSACCMEDHERPDFDDLPEILSIEIERAHPHPISFLCEVEHRESWATLYPTILSMLHACRLIPMEISWVAGTWTTRLGQLSQSM